MKDIDKKDVPDVSGGYVPYPGYGDCFPFPEDPIEPAEPTIPLIDPWTDPAANRT